MMKPLYAAIGLIMLTSTPTTAQDRCPTHADLETGVRLMHTQHGFQRVYVQRPDGLYEGQVDSPNAPPNGAWWRLPHPILPSLRATEAGRLTMIYDADVAGINDLAQGEVWTSKVTYLLDGTPHALGSFEVHANGPSPLSPRNMGSCQYDTVTYRVTEHINTASSIYTEVDYAPKLGLVIGTTPLDEMGTPHGGFWFNALTVEELR